MYIESEIDGVSLTPITAGFREKIRMAETFPDACTYFLGISLGQRTSTVLGGIPTSGGLDTQTEEEALFSAEQRRFWHLLLLLLSLLSLLLPFLCFLFAAVGIVCVVVVVCYGRLCVCLASFRSSLFVQPLSSARGHPRPPSFCPGRSVLRLDARPESMSRCALPTSLDILGGPGTAQEQRALPGQLALFRAQCTLCRSDLCSRNCRYCIRQPLSELHIG